MYDNDFQIKVGMKYFYSVHLLQREKNHKITDFGYLGFETKKEMQDYIDREKEKNAYLIFNTQKIKLKYGRVKSI